jgi:hypothetical protein
MNIGLMNSGFKKKMSTLWRGQGKSFFHIAVLNEIRLLVVGESGVSERPTLLVVSCVFQDQFTLFYETKKLN